MSDGYDDASGKPSDDDADRDSSASGKPSDDDDGYDLPGIWPP